MPVRAVVEGMNELPQDFRDLLVELADAGADFVVLGGHAVAFHVILARRREQDLADVAALQAVAPRSLR